jgi:hypothetical protein
MMSSRVSHGVDTCGALGLLSVARRSRSAHVEVNPEPAR